MFGGSGQGTASVTTSLDFSPVFQIGESQTSNLDKRTRLDSVQSPKLDDSFGLSGSVGVGVGGGSGSGGLASLSSTDGQTDPQTTGTRSVSSGFKNVNGSMLLLGGGAILLLAATQLKSKKKKSA